MKFPALPAVGVDAHISNKEAGHLARLGFIVVPTLQGEDDKSFLLRCHFYKCIAVISRDTDIQVLLDQDENAPPVFKSAGGVEKAIRTGKLKCRN